MHDTAYMDHVNVVKLLDINKAHFAYDMADLMNKVDPDMAKVRMFSCDVMGGWHCDTFYEGPGLLSQVTVTSRCHLLAPVTEVYDSRDAPGDVGDHRVAHRFRHGHRGSDMHVGVGGCLVERAVFDKQPPRL